MKLISLEAGRKDGSVKAQFSDGSSLEFTTEYMTYRGMEIGAEGSHPVFTVPETGRDLSSVEEEAFRFAADCYRAEKAALRLIARAEQNSFGLRAKLERRGFDAAAARTVVSCLLSRNLLDDRRYAELWIRTRLGSGKVFSPRWLLACLGKKGIDRDSSQRALKNMLDPDTESALLERFLKKNRRKNPGLSGKGGRNSEKSLLKYEGFSFNVLNSYFND